jgi:hypothetical protein
MDRSTPRRALARSVCSSSDAAGSPHGCCADTHGIKRVLKVAVADRSLGARVIHWVCRFEGRQLCSCISNAHNRRKGREVDRKIPCVKQGTGRRIRASRHDRTRLFEGRSRAGLPVKKDLPVPNGRTSRGQLAPAGRAGHVPPPTTGTVGVGGNSKTLTPTLVQPLHSDGGRLSRAPTFPAQRGPRS